MTPPTLRAVLAALPNATRLDLVRGLQDLARERLDASAAETNSIMAIRMIGQAGGIGLVVDMALEVGTQRCASCDRPIVGELAPASVTNDDRAFCQACAVDEDPRDGWYDRRMAPT